MLGEQLGEPRKPDLVVTRAALTDRRCAIPAAIERLKRCMLTHAWEDFDTTRKPSKSIEKKPIPKP